MQDKKENKQDNSTQNNLQQENTKLKQIIAEYNTQMIINSQKEFNKFLMNQSLQMQEDLSSLKIGVNQIIDFLNEEGSKESEHEDLTQEEVDGHNKTIDAIDEEPSIIELKNKIKELEAERNKSKKKK